MSDYQDQDELEEQPAPDLAAYADAAIQAMAARAAEDEEESDPGPVPEADDTTRLDAWIASLTPRELERAAGDEQWATSSFEAFEERQAERAAYERGIYPPDAESDDQEAAPQTAGEFVAFARANAEGIRAQFGMSVSE